MYQNRYEPGNTVIYRRAGVLDTGHILHINKTNFKIISCSSQKVTEVQKHAVIALADFEMYFDMFCDIELPDSNTSKDLLLRIHKLYRMRCDNVIGQIVHERSYVDDTFIDEADSRIGTFFNDFDSLIEKFNDSTRDMFKDEKPF